MANKKKLKLSNLDCAACAAKLAEEVNRQKGVKSASVDFMRSTLFVEYETDEGLARAIKTANSFEEVRVCVEDKEGKESVFRRYKADIVCIILSAVLLAATFFLPKEKYFWAEILSYILYGGAYLVVGWKILIETAKNLAHGRIFDENFLMVIASVGAMCLMQFSEAVEVMLLYSLGELLQSIAVGASRRSIADLMDLKSESATLLCGGEEKIVSPEEIEAGDLLLVKAGEKIAVDGIVEKGKTSLDVKSLNGESAYRDVGEGDAVMGGSINVSGVIEVRAAKPYAESTVAKILDLVENSAAKKAKPEKFITKFAKIYTPVVCIAALAVAFGVPLFLPGSYLSSLGEWVYRALTFLVISCPCALVISVPLSYFSGIGFAAKHGILMKGSTGIDALARAKIAAFDKTGTLTYGNFTVKQTRGEYKEEALGVAAALEKHSSHPLARAFDGVSSPYIAEEVRELPGLGISAKIGGEISLAGNKKLMEKYGVRCEDEKAAGTLVFVARGGRYLGCVEIEDEVKDNAKTALEELRSLGIGKTVMLTGDNAVRAGSVARQVGVGEVYAGLLPDEKLEIAEKLKKEGALVYVGDGINDAPVLIAADAGISMGGVGSDAAIEASDAVLMRDDLSNVPLAIRASKRTKSIVMQNIVLAIALKVVIMVLSLTVDLPLWVAVLADVGVMMLAVLNSFRTRIPFRKTKARKENGARPVHG